MSANTNLEPGGLVLGNYYDGEVNNLGFLLKNTSTGVGLAANEGFQPVFVGANSPVVDEDTFSHPLNAEIHEVKIYNKVLANPEKMLKRAGEYGYDKAQLPPADMTTEWACSTK